MMDNLRKPIEKEISKKRLSLIYVGSAHIKKRGVVRIKMPEGGETEIMHLGSRLFMAFPRTVSINQNDPMGDCEDLIETKAKESGLKEITLLNLNTHPFGNLESIYCAVEYPLPHTYIPSPFKAKDHFDYYLYYPHR
ncbi:MAG TPA: hypothetical protein DCL44_08355 [Elusimicrobia bacterium]|nr:hypothetical protein [Elusimicrobiota bacterium]